MVKEIKVSCFKQVKSIVDAAALRARGEHPGPEGLDCGCQEHPGLDEPGLQQPRAADGGGPAEVEQVYNALVQ